MESNQGSNAFEGDQGSRDQDHPPSSPLFFPEDTEILNLFGGHLLPNFDDDAMDVGDSFSATLEGDTYVDPLASVFRDPVAERFGPRPDDTWDHFIKPAPANRQDTSFNSVDQNGTLTTASHDLGSSDSWEEFVQPGPFNQQNTSNSRIEQIDTSTHQNTSFNSVSEPGRSISESNICEDLFNSLLTQNDQTASQNTSFNSVDQNVTFTTESHDLESNDFWDEFIQPDPSTNLNTSYEERSAQTCGFTAARLEARRQNDVHPTPNTLASALVDPRLRNDISAPVDLMDATNQSTAAPIMSEKQRGKQPVYNPPVPSRPSAMLPPAIPSHNGNDCAFADAFQGEYNQEDEDEGEDDDDDDSEDDDDDYHVPPAAPLHTFTLMNLAPLMASNVRPVFPNVAFLLNSVAKARDARTGVFRGRIPLESMRRYGRELVSLTREVEAMKARVEGSIPQVKAALAAMWSTVADLKKRGLRGGHARKLRASGTYYKSFKDMTPRENERRKAVEARDYLGRNKIKGLKAILSLAKECLEDLRVQMGLCNEVFRQAGLLSCMTTTPQGLVDAESRFRAALAASLQRLKKVQEIEPMLAVFRDEFQL